MLGPVRPISAAWYWPDVTESMGTVDKVSSQLRFIVAGMDPCEHDLAKNLGV